MSGAANAALKAETRLLRLLLGVLTVVRLAVAAATPLSPDEAYYWIWSRALQPGYLDHPPMVALWIRAGTDLFGQTAIGVRLIAPLSALVGSLIIYRAADDLFPGRRAGLAAVTMLNATLFLGAGAVIMTPDTPLILFWCCAVFCLARVFNGGYPGWWYAAGLSTGLAADSKYTAALLPLSVGCALVACPALRFWFRRKEPYIAGLIAVLAFEPVFAWNAAHHWASFGKQGGRVGDFDPTRAVRYVSELVLGQCGLATPIIFLACIGGVAWAARQRTQPATALLAAVTIVPAIVFFQHALGDRVQANWPCVLYPGACLAAAGWGFRRWKAASYLGYAISALVYVQAVFGIFPLSRQVDPSLAQLGGWRAWALQADQVRKDHKLGYIGSENYGEASLLAWYLPNTPIVAVQPRWAFFRYPSAAAVTDHADGLLIRAAHDAVPPAIEGPPWVDARYLDRLTRVRGKIVASRSDLYRVRLMGESGLAGSGPVLLK